MGANKVGIKHESILGAINAILRMTDRAYAGIYIIMQIKGNCYR